MSEHEEIAEVIKSDRDKLSDAMAEIERLRSIRNATIEECARVVEAYDVWHEDYVADPIVAAAIRALKEKP